MLINLIDVDGCQLIFSSELALSIVEALTHVHRLQRYALAMGWHHACVTVQHQGRTLSYGLLESVTCNGLENAVRLAQ